MNKTKSLVFIAALFLGLEASAAYLPWTEYASASESASSETSAKYFTETSLRYQIDRYKYRCQSDKGDFSYYSSTMTCYKSGSTYRCSANATCRCRQTIR